MIDLTDRRISAEIVAACRAGDRDAFRALYELYKDRVFSIALHFFHGDRTAASDVTQQVFLKLMTSMENFRGDAEFSTWLYRLVVNACTDMVRRNKKVVVGVERETLEALPGPSSQDAEFELAQKVESVQTALGALPPKLRIALLLRYFEDLSYEEMASTLQCSMGTVASRLNRGLKMLAEKLPDYGRSTRK